VRADRRRPKKLTVAFHFLFANQAAWRCDTCRRDGLEKKRNCGWLVQVEHASKPVWVRNGIAVTACPKSVITGESQALLEDYQTRKTLGDFRNLSHLPARLVDAFLLLEQLVVKERSHEQ
jgi:hypothetical protein